MEDAYKKRVEAYYEDALAKPETDFNTVKWGSSASQSLRFEVFWDMLPDAPESILDIGCGVGHFAQFLNQKEYQGKYLGVDLLPEMVVRAKHENAGKDFIVKDIYQADDLSADYVFASGIFTVSDDENMEKTIRKMWQFADKGICFNCLSGWGNENKNDEYCPNPADVLALCMTLSKRVLFRHDYHPFDFTIMVLKP